MNESIAAVFFLSIAGSLHCAGMCGAFVAFAVSAPTIGGAEATQPPNRNLLHIAYNGGRLVTYMILGAIAGTIGAALDLGGEQVGIARTAMLIAGAVMIGFGVIAFLRLRGVRLPSAPVPARWRALIARGQRYAMGKPPVVRALTIGLLTTLLPCGWLYVFAVYAASTGSAATGALTMAVFWVGTLPVLVAIGEGAGRLAGIFGKHLPTLTTAAIVLVGVWTIIGRTDIPALDQPEATPVSDTAALDQLKSDAEAPMPCCAEPADDTAHAH